MDTVVNKITNVILGINITNVPASYIIHVADNFNFTKTINEVQYTREYVTPNMITSGQFKPSDLNKPLYMDGGGNLTTNQTGTPAVMRVTVPVTYDFVKNPTKFTVDDVTNGKANFLVKQGMYKFMVLDEVINSNSIDLDKSRNINLGVKDIEIMVGGTCYMNPITLAQSTKIFSSYIESTSDVGFELGYLDANGNVQWVDFTNTPMILPIPVSTIYLRLVSKSITTSQHVSSYGVLF